MGGAHSLLWEVLDLEVMEFFLFGDIRALTDFDWLGFELFYIKQVNEWLCVRVYEGLR